MTLLGLLLGLVIVASVPSDPDTFRAEMMQRLMRDHPEHRFERGDDPLAIRKDSGNKADEGILNLHNLHAYCSAAEVAACESAKADWARRVMLAPQPVTRASLRLLVRNAEYVAYANNPTVGAATVQPSIFSRSIGDDLYLLVASDAPETIQLVGARQAAAMKMSEVEVWSAAEANMQAIIPNLPSASGLRRQAAGFEGIPYGSAMLGRLAHWQKVAEESTGEMFITVVSDDFLLAGMLADKDVAGFAATVREDCAQAPRCISPHIYRFRAGGWRIAEQVPTASGARAPSR